ncbi:SpoIID/LytB domain-containing protein [Kovacikia minuta CCNUW1]|uniref:SpoIID/LytB domain-containing protein n=1 Tax=Kovacikia minuta TaxID=2931930 RepID=UPI001CCC0F37|nr:SpoIID/LytB domain-containing protein [Kovacikia minuta]UBF25320.1 SpoIID/LytB domain-containing protein [Kovacikia minuta CCNUW1]
MKLSIKRLTLMGVATSFFLACTTELGLTASQTKKDIELQIGVVQRFGRKPKDTLTLQAKSGDRLTLRFQTDGKLQTLTGSTAKFDLQMQSLAEPKVEERVVLSTHRSFESAEDSANRWRAQGIPVEIAQPSRWQVWAKRDVYSTPLLRRLLLQSLQAEGIQAAFIDTQVVQQQPRASFVVNGFRYTRDRVDISSGLGVIQVTHPGSDPSRLYAGSLRLQPNAYGTYTLVNQVPVETYLRGVVPHEIGTFAAQSVLEVQAILARTYALRNLRRFTIDNYQLCADTQCQVYYGLTGAHPTTDRAIAATKGLVLTYQNELVDAVYSSSTGGVTAPFNDVWYGPERPYLRAIVDSVGGSWDLSRKTLADEKNFRSFISQKKGFNEEKEEWFRWKFQSRLEDLSQELKDYLVSQKSTLAGFKTIQQMQVTKRSPAGRVLELTITTDLGRVKLQKDDVRKVFEEPASTLFYLEPIYDQKRVLKGYSFVGGGLGHGVGLSQTGSYHLGKLGWSSDRILRFYFPGTQLQPINDSIVFWRDALNDQATR